MRDIQEKFEGIQSINDYINESIEANVNEGLKDLFNLVKSKFQKAWAYMKGIVVKVGSRILPVDDQGNVIPAQDGLTAGQSMTDGWIDKKTTVVILDKNGQQITKCKMNIKHAKALYGSGDSRSWWRKMLRESQERADNTINEVKLQNQDPEAKYNVICDDKKLAQMIINTIKYKQLKPLLIYGAPGIGKTAIIETVYKTMVEKFPDYQIIVKTLSNETPDNFSLPKYVNVNGTEMADDVPKVWLPVYKPCEDPEENAIRDAKCGNGLLFIDELSRATPQVLNVMLPLINERRIAGCVLGSGWTIVTASNRAEDENAGQAEIGNALGNRFAQVYYEPTIDTWENWAKRENYISPILLSWLKMPEGENLSGGKFFYMDPNEDIQSGDVTKLMCTPRSWTNAMRELALYHHTGTLEGFQLFDIDDDILAMTLNKYVPASAVDSFLAFLKVIKEIGDFDRAVMDIWKNGGKNFKIEKKKLNMISIPLAQLICSAHADKLPTEKEFESLCEWLIAQKSDQLCSYTLDVFKNIFLTTPHIDDTVRDNIFFLKAKIEKVKNDSKKNETEKQANIVLYTEMFHEFFDKWGLTIDTLPDYSPALKNLGGTYKEAFKAAIVDGVEALG